MCPKWHTIYTVHLSTVHPCVHLTNVVSGIFCHAFILCVTPMSSILSVFKLLFVGCMCGFWVFVFQFVLELSSTGSVTICLSNWSWRYCSAVVCVGFTCLLFLVITCPVFVTCIVNDLSLWLWSPFPTNVPWVHSPPSSHWTATVDPFRMRP